MTACRRRSPERAAVPGPRRIPTANPDPRPSFRDAATSHRRGARAPWTGAVRGARRPRPSGAAQPGRSRCSMRRLRPTDSRRTRNRGRAGAPAAPDPGLSAARTRDHPRGTRARGRCRRQTSHRHPRRRRRGSPPPPRWPARPPEWRRAVRPWACSDGSRLPSPALRYRPTAGARRRPLSDFLTVRGSAEKAA